MLVEIMLVIEHANMKGWNSLLLKCDCHFGEAF